MPCGNVPATAYASARSMLSPPRRMCSPTARRESTRSPFSSLTLISVKSVVPPPTSQTRMMSPALTLLAPSRAFGLEPGIERGLRLLEQRDILQSSLGSRLGGELARHRVERSGNGQVDVLILEPVGRGLARNPSVPGVAQVLEVGGGRRDRRDPLDVRRGRPRQYRGATIHSGMREPALRRADQPAGDLGAMISGEDSGHAVGGRLPRQGKRIRRELLGRRQVQERRQ